MELKKLDKEPESAMRSSWGYKLVYWMILFSFFQLDAGQFWCVENIY